MPFLHACENKRFKKASDHFLEGPNPPQFRAGTRFRRFEGGNWRALHPLYANF